ncbi:MAG: hypothetical protein IBJ06_08730 [Brevundimonas sp.]|nr:hypothetical protein [Brevundimonas sp.]
MMRALLSCLVAAALLAGCSTDFWDMDPEMRIALPPGQATALRVDRIEIRSSYYDPPDAFSEAFIPAFQSQTDACARGQSPVRAVVFIHALDRGGTLLDDQGQARLSGSVDLIDARGRVIGRYPLSAQMPGPAGDLGERRSALGEALGAQLCREAFAAGS